MSEWITRQEAKLMMWRLGAVLLVLFALDSIATAFVSVMIDTNLSELTGTQIAIRVALIVKAVASTVAAALTTIIGKLQKNEFPIPPVLGGKGEQTETKEGTK